MALRSPLNVFVVRVLLALNVFEEAFEIVPIEEAPEAVPTNLMLPPLPERELILLAPSSRRVELFPTVTLTEAEFDPPVPFVPSAVMLLRDRFPPSRLRLSPLLVLLAEKPLIVVVPLLKLMML